MKTAEDLDLPQILIICQDEIGISYVALSICEFGQKVSDQFEAFGKKLERCDWCLLPAEMQRMYLIFIAHTQQTPNVQAYGNILCTRLSKFVRVFDKSNFTFNGFCIDLVMAILNFSYSQKNSKTCHVKCVNSNNIFLLIFFYFHKTIHGGISYFMTLHQMYG